MSPKDVSAKAIALLEPIIGKKTTQAVDQAIWSLESMEDINELASIVLGGNQ